jgi:hypothetical protein
MTTSEYLQAQAELLVMAVGLRKLPLEEFAARAREIAGDVLLDARGNKVATDGAGMAEIAAAAIEFRDRLARRRDVGREAAAAAAKTRRTA